MEVVSARSSNSTVIPRESTASTVAFNPSCPGRPSLYEIRPPFLTWKIILGFICFGWVPLPLRRKAGQPQQLLHFLHPLRAILPVRGVGQSKQLACRVGRTFPNQPQPTLVPPRQANIRRC